MEAETEAETASIAATTGGPTVSVLEELNAYTANDISDALLKLEIPGAGYLPDIKPIPSFGTSQADTTKTMARASTVLFVPKSSPSFPNAAPPLQMVTQTLSQPLPNIPDGALYSDLTVPDTIVVISQPKDQVCAVVGGIMAARTRKLGAKGICVDGRVRDLAELRSQGIPIWSKATSTIATGAQAKAWAVGVPVTIGTTVVEPDDVIMLDPESSAAVSIPKHLVSRVLEILPGIVGADEKVMEEVEAGGDVGSAFRKYRGK